MPKKRTKKSGGKKLRVAIVGLTSCDGCSVSILDMGLDFIETIDHFDLGDFFIIMDEKNSKPYDVAIIEGAPLTRKNIATLKEIRKRTEYLIGIGACAHFGVIPNIKNYMNKSKAAQYVYPNVHKKIENMNIRSIKRFVKVDFIIPGCPPEGKDFRTVLNAIRQGISPKLLENPICYECQLNNNECVLQKGEPCLGPVIQGGCNAVCLNSKFACKGCRGIIPGYDTKPLEIELLKRISRKKLNEILQVFGIQEDWYKQRK